MLDIIRKYIERNRLLDKNVTHIVALSGGADSVCLLRVMLLLGYKTHAAHCNFHLRGGESDRDENFCKLLCKSLGVQLHLAHFDTRAFAQERHLSIEMAARDLRYSYFEQLRLAIDAADIVVAHHKDDNVETVLMNLIRGTGINGLQGIKPRNGHIIRPLLAIGRKDILAFLGDISQDYITDSSNLVDDVVRNKIRLNIIPMLRDINPAVIENITRTIENISESVKIVDNAIRTSVEVCARDEQGYKVIEKKVLTEQASPEQILFSILSPYGFTSGQIRMIYGNIKSSPGKVWHSQDYTLASDRDTFIIGEKVCDILANPVELPEPGIYNISCEGGKMAVTEEERKPGFAPSKDSHCATIDADSVSFPLVIRKARQGDRFLPYGMKGAKLISDYLTDKKRNYFQRSRQLVVEDAKGVIIWLVGERISQKAACNDDTIKILTLRYIDKSSL